MVSLQDFITFSNANTSLNVISLLSGLLVALIILIIRWHDELFMERISMRFTLAIALVDALRATSFLVYAEIRGEGLICSIVAFTNQSFTLMYLFLTVVIAINLQIVFLNSHVTDRNYELSYWIISIGLAIGLPLIPLSLGKLGYDHQNRTCEYVTSVGFNSYFWLWSTFLGWIVLACVYCTIIVTKVIIKLKDKTSVLHKSLDSYQNQIKSETFQIMIKDIKKLIKRILLYCLVPIFTQIGHISLRIYEFYHNKPNINMAYFSVITTDLAGFLNLIAFLLDPAFINTFKKISTQTSLTIFHKKPILEKKDFELRSSLNSDQTHIIINPQDHSPYDSIINNNEKYSISHIKIDFKNFFQKNNLLTESNHSSKIRDSSATNYLIDSEITNCRYQRVLQRAELALSNLKSRL